MSLRFKIATWLLDRCTAHEKVRAICRMEDHLGWHTWGQFTQDEVVEDLEDKVNIGAINAMPSEEEILAGCEAAAKFDVSDMSTAVRECAVEVAIRLMKERLAPIDNLTVGEITVDKLEIHDGLFLH